MKHEEVVEKLLAKEKIHPGLTELAWKKLEEQLQEFFKANHLEKFLDEHHVDMVRANNNLHSYLKYYSISNCEYNSCNTLGTSKNFSTI